MAEQTQGAGLFMDYKLGEANEIKAALRELSSNKAGEARQKRDIIQKVVGYMTLGLDMSSVFMEILMQAQTRDVVQKKLIYLYLVGYSTIDPQKTMMAISTLQKDCFDDDPVIRGLALRSLCSVRVKDLTEYVVDPLKKGLADSTPYVRKTAVMGCLKLYITSPETAKSFRVNEQLLGMVRDRDPQVVANCMYVLNEIFISQGGLTLDHKTIVHLLNRMRDFNDWAQCMLLEVVSRHEPKDQSELIDIMNLLETRLRSTNCGVILAITKVFLHLTVEIPKLHKQVFSRLRAPIITHMASAGPELAFSCLQHILLLVNRNPEVFQNDYKRFFVRVNDPAYTKKIKLDILVELVTDDPTVLAAIVQEIQHNTQDLDEAVARHAVAKVGDVASKLTPEQRGQVFSRLVGMLEKSSTSVMNAAIQAIVTSLRKYPDTAGEVVPALQKLICEKHQDLSTVDARVSALFVLGEFGYTWPDAPYVLEDMCENFAEEPSPLVRLQMLNTTARMFFQRPAEIKKLLATLLKESIEEDEEDEGTTGPKPGDSQDVRDRALLYYRLLQGKIQVAYGVICGQRQPIDKYAEEDSVELKEIIFKEFNTLSVVYNKPAEAFLLPYPEPGILFEEEEEEEEEEAAAEEAAAAVEAPVEIPPPGLNAAAAAVTQKQFGAVWGTVSGQQTTCQAGGNADVVLGKLQPMGFKALAKGNTPDGGAKVYVYCGFLDDQTGPGGYGYIEMIISPTGAVQATVKCDGDDPRKTKFLIDNLPMAIA